MSSPSALRVLWLKGLFWLLCCAGKLSEDQEFCKWFLVHHRRKAFFILEHRMIQKSLKFVNFLFSFCWDFEIIEQFFHKFLVLFRAGIPSAACAAHKANLCLKGKDSVCSISHWHLYLNVSLLMLHLIQIREPST